MDISDTVDKNHIHNTLDSSPDSRIREGSRKWEEKPAVHAVVQMFYPGSGCIFVKCRV